jgi:hypothetical protein
MTDATQFSNDEVEELIRRGHIPSLLEARDWLVGHAEKITEAAASECRGMTPAALADVDLLMARAATLTAAIDKERSLSSTTGKLTPIETR